MKNPNNKEECYEKGADRGYFSGLMFAEEKIKKWFGDFDEKD